MVTTRYSDQQGSKSRQKVMRLYKQWHRPISKRFIKPPYSIREQPRSTRNVVAYPRPAFSAKNRKNYAPTSFDQQVQVSQGHTFCTEIRKIEIPREVSLGQQYNVGEKPTMILYTSINRHVATPRKTKAKYTMSLYYSSITAQFVTLGPGHSRS